MTIRLLAASTASRAFYQRFKKDPKNRTELCQQKRFAAALKKDHVLHFDVNHFDKKAREAFDTVKKFRAFERQADENWRSLPPNLLSKHKNCDGTYHLSSLKKEIHDRRRQAEVQCKEFERLSSEARDKRDQYERERRTQRKWSLTGALIGAAVGIGVDDFRATGVLGAAVGGGIRKGLDNPKAMSKAYEEMSADRNYYRSMGYL